MVVRRPAASNGRGRVRLNLTPGQDIRATLAITPRPQPGVWVTASRR